MRAVVDASYAVAAIWEDAVADRLDLAFGEPALVPEVFPVEVANAAVVKVRRGLLSVNEARSGLRDLLDSVTVMRGVPELDVFDLALATTRSVYDAAYLACAQSHGVSLWTFDKRLRAAAEASGVTVLP